MKKSVKVLCALVLVAVIVMVYRYAQPKNTVSYITEPVVRGMISQTVSANGEISASHLVDVGAQVSGQIKKMYVQIGDAVKKGDPIADIDNTAQINTLNARKAQLGSYQAQWESARVALKNAQRKYERYRSLMQEGAVSQIEMEDAEGALSMARAQMKQLEASIKETKIAIHTAQTDVGYTRIIAPVDGTVVSLVVEVGQTINSSQTSPTVVQIADLSEMTNKMQIAEGDATKVKAGQPVEFTILSEPDKPIRTTLGSVDPGLTTMSQGAYNKSTDTTANAIFYYARAHVPNPDSTLAIGMTTQNTIEIARADNVLTVPSVAVKSRDGKQFVRVLGADNQAVEKAVQTGLKDNMNTEITAGLNEGEQVILSEMNAGEKAAEQRSGVRPPRR